MHPVRPRKSRDTSLFKGPSSYVAQLYPYAAFKFGVFCLILHSTKRALWFWGGIRICNGGVFANQTDITIGVGIMNNNNPI